MVLRLLKLAVLALIVAACAQATPTEHVIVITASVPTAQASATSVAAAVTNTPAPHETTPLPPCSDEVTGPCELVVGTAEPTKPPLLPPTKTLTPTATFTTQPETATAQALATALPAPTSVAGAPTITETSITINSYAWQEHLAYTQAGDPIYPYPRLDYDPFTFDAGNATPRTFKALVLENNYVRLTILPELGGRIYQWVDKVTGRSLLYNNPVIKATGYGYRGWWLSAGGIEWSLPVPDHGFVEWLPWYYTTITTADTAAVVVSIDEENTGLEAAIRIELDSTHSYFTLSPFLYNPNPTPLPYHFWIAAVASPAGNNKAGPDLVFNVPTDSMQVHSTDDKTLPSVGQTITWPSYKSRDLSLYGNWKEFLSLFATTGATQPYTGLYASSVNQGLVRVFPQQTARGIKLFGPGNLPSFLWTSDESDSSYVELWGGVTANFSESALLPSEDSIAWTEYWYPFSNIGNYVWADKDRALALEETTGAITVRLYTTSAQTVAVTLFVTKAPVARWDAVTTAPGVWQNTWTRNATGEAGVTLTDGAGNIIGRYGLTP
jgi:Domain of unknown function (DUF5107)